MNLNVVATENISIYSCFSINQFFIKFYTFRSSNIKFLYFYESATKRYEMQQISTELISMQQLW